MEKWVAMKNHFNYSVSDFGNIKNPKGELLKPYSTGRYLCIEIKNKNYKIHRLLMEYFYGKSELQINHKNGIKTDNKIINLEYCTGKENVRHAVKNGLFNNSLIASERLREKQRIKIKSINLITGEEENYNSTHEASFKKGVSQGNISECIRGKRSKASGYKWVIA